jgi:hypothetical protein
VKEQSHKSEMSAAIRGDFERLRERGVAATLAPRDDGTPEPVELVPEHEEPAVTVLPTAPPELDGTAEAVEEDAPGEAAAPGDVATPDEAATPEEAAALGDAARPDEATAPGFFSRLFGR